jgi:hypothetical protein
VEHVGDLREITRLKNLLANRDKTSRLRPHAEEIYEFWKTHVHPKSTAFGKKRMKAVIERLGEGKDDIEGRKAEIKEAILGAVTDAYVGPNGVKYDDLDLICRDETYIRRFRAAFQARQGDLCLVPDPDLSPVERGFLKLLERGENPFHHWPEANPVCVHSDCSTIVSHNEWVCEDHQEWHIAFLNRCSDLIRLREAA